MPGKKHKPVGVGQTHSKALTDDLLFFLMYGTSQDINQAESVLAELTRRMDERKSSLIRREEG